MSLPASKPSRPATGDTRSVKEIQADLIGKIDFVREYKALGAKLVSDTPRANGAIECYSLFREEATPSAYINTITGKYGDSGAKGKQIHIWQVAADLERFASWELARENYANLYGETFIRGKAGRAARKKLAGNVGVAAAVAVEPKAPAPRKPLESWLNVVRPDRESQGALNFIRHFPLYKNKNKAGQFVAGIFGQAEILAAGGFYSKWPYGRKNEDGSEKDASQQVVGVPVYGQAILTAVTIDDTAAVGAIIWQKNATPFQNKDGTEGPKMRTVVTGDGLVGRHGIQLIVDDRARQARGELSTIDRVWKVEGPTDLLALYTAMPAELRDRQPIISTAGGSTSISPWTAEFIRGYDVYTIHDLDTAGQAGAIKTCETWGPAARSITPIQLAGEVERKHGRDVRDYFIGGGTFEAIEVETLVTATFEVTDAHRAAYEKLATTAAKSPSTPQATGAEGDADSDFAPLEADDDPHRLARNYLEQYAWSPDYGTKLRFWRQEWQLWNGRAYVNIDPIDLTGKVNRSIKEEFNRINIAAQEKFEDGAGDEDPPFALKVSRSLVQDAVAAIQGECLLPSDQEAPFWIDGKGPWPANEGFAMGSGIIHLASLVDGKADNLWPSTPNFFSPNAVHYGFPGNDPKKCPPPTRWLSFLDSLWGDDEQQIQLLQEWMGYCLLPDTSQQKLLLFIGPKRSGKGTIARTLTQLVGENNVVNPRLSQFDKEYGMWPLVGKTVAIIGDARLSGRTNTAEIVETLLSVSGEDKQTVNRKHMSYVHTRLRTRFTILSNAMPDLQDTSGAFHSRCLLLETKHSFEGRENKHLEHELLEELPGILIWAIQGWARLRERGRFEQPDSSKNALKQFEYLTSPMKKFLDEFCILGNEEWVSVDLAFNAYCDFCKSNKLPKSTKPVFARDLKSVINHMHTTQRRDKSGERFRVFTGFRLKSESELFFDETEE